MHPQNTSACLIQFVTRKVGKVQLVILEVRKVIPPIYPAATSPSVHEGRRWELRTPDPPVDLFLRLLLCAEILH